MGRILKPWIGLFPDEEDRKTALGASKGEGHRTSTLVGVAALSCLGSLAVLWARSKPTATTTAQPAESIFALSWKWSLVMVAVSLLWNFWDHPLVSACRGTLAKSDAAATMQSWLRKWLDFQEPSTLPSTSPEIVEKIVAVNCTCLALKTPPMLKRIDSGYASPAEELMEPRAQRTVTECTALYKSKQGHELTDVELIELSLRGVIPSHKLEVVTGDHTRAVQIRRAVISRNPDANQYASLETSQLPYTHYDFEKVYGSCAENVVGYMPIPVGVAGPLLVDGLSVFLPMATTEGTLIASTSRGAKALNASGGVSTVVTADGMTRGPVVRFDDIKQAAGAKRWIESPEGFAVLSGAFSSTTRYGQLRRVTATLAGSYVYMRFKAVTGEAMGMNMIGKGVQKALEVMRHQAGFEQMEIISLSGNICTDKKPAAINWIDGRGKSVVAQSIIPAKVVRDVLRCSVPSLVRLNTSKNLVGSALAGMSAGGFNAHAANIVTAIFIATGQDPAQNVTSSNCLTLLEETNQGDLCISVTMPSIEVGTVGGGTSLGPQSAMLNLMGISKDSPTTGENAGTLARTIAAAVLAGELSLCSALATDELIKSHMTFNRKN